jgi:putative membrane protein
MRTTTAGVASVACALIVVLVGLLAVSGVAVAHGGDDGRHHHDGVMGHDGTMGHDGWMGGFGWLWGPVVMLLVVGLPLVAAVVLLRERRDGGDGDALTVLRQRYAAGEIDDEEFERRRDRLT